MSKNVDQYNDLKCGEISSLWMSFQYETMHKCGITFFLQHVEDKAIQRILEDALAISTKRINATKELLTKYDHAIPHGFTDGDVNLKAPRLFTDMLYLLYILQTIEVEITHYNLAVRQALNPEIMEHFHAIVQDSLKLEIKTKDLAKEKGIFIPQPAIPKQTQIEYVQKDHFLAGWLGEKRPLLGIEISQLVQHAKRNAIGQAVITAFSQVANAKEIRRFFERGREIAGKHVNVMTSKLHEDYLPSSSLLKTSEVTDSTEAPFTDKLMTVFITVLINIGIGEYGSSIAMSPRRD